ncbi:MAG: hypothetical protein CEE38_22170 [Planctomycetes bacterium B3_Pla]|nr:MAG: hypothetical protein CEE38_22170 [Planctomycetes bacterium B3_Pla]
MKTVLFLGFDKNFGLTYHFVDWIIALRKAVSDKLKIILLTLKKEQNVGLHEQLRKNRFIDVVMINKPEELESIKFLGDVDIVHCHGFTHVAKMLKIKRANKLKYKIVVTIHSFRNSTPYSHVYSNLLSFFYNKIDAIHFLSHAAKHEFLRGNLLYNHSNRSFIFPLGCNEAEFLRDESIEGLDFYQELIQNEKNIIYLANLSRGKQHLWLLKAIKNILIEEDACLWLFGDKGTETEEVVRYINENGLSQHVKLPGRIHRKYIPNILRRMDCAVCSSRSETFGHVIMEPMFAGIPVVTFNVGAASYLIRDFTNGFVVRNTSEQENFRKAVEFLLKNKDASTEMGKNNKKIAHQWLTWEATCKNSVNMYLSI